MRRYKQEVPRAEFVRQRRTSKSKHQGQKPPVVTQTVRTVRPGSTASRFLPVESSRATRRPQTRTDRAGRPRYEFAFTAANTRVSTPGISLPSFNMRWVSAILTACLLFGLYSLWNSAAFKFTGAEVSGNLRLSQADIDACLGLVDKPIFLAVPGDLQEKLRREHRDLESAKVRVLFPNRIVVDVRERVPLLAWYEDDNGVAWIDVNGVAFPARGTSETLVNVVASQHPAQVLDESKPDYEQAYISPAMVQALVNFHASVPAGVPMIYHPEYGIGWQESDWQVYFGHTTDDIDLKIAAYQAIVPALLSEGREFSLISLEYLDTPFFK